MAVPTTFIGISSTKIITDLQVEPISINEVKAAIFLDTDDYDELLLDLIKRSRNLVETYCSKSLGERTFAVGFDYLSNVELRPKPFISVVSVMSFDTVPVAVTYKVINEKVILDTPQACLITFKAGYTSVPDGLKLAVIELVKHGFTTQLVEMTESVKCMIRPFIDGNLLV